MEHGTVTHSGNRYDLGQLFERAKTRPISSVSVANLNWIIERLISPCDSCKHGPESWHEERIKTVDLDIPVLVLIDNSAYYLIDGLHRLIKANREEVKHLPCKFIFPIDMRKALI